MSAAAAIARVVLAAVLLVAAAGKLADLEQARRTVREFSVPASVSGPIALALPVLELAVGVALIVPATALRAAAAALGLLLALSAVVDQWTDCGSYCSDLKDELNCGACGAACGDGQYCIGGVCKSV